MAEGAAARDAAAPGLPQAIRSRLGELADHYPTREALLLPALHMAQEHWGGWLPDEAILAVAEELDLAPAKVYGVVTFYDLFHQEPVGRHRLRVCTNLPCALRGADEIVDALRHELGVDEGEVTADGRCSWVRFECLGACEQAPMLMVDGAYRGHLTPRALGRLLEELE